MASGRSSWFQRNILYKIPFLYKICPGGNYHKAWDRLCFCRMENIMETGMAVSMILKMSQNTNAVNPVKSVNGEYR